MHRRLHDAQEGRKPFGHLCSTALSPARARTGIRAVEISHLELAFNETPDDLALETTAEHSNVEGTLHSLLDQLVNLWEHLHCCAGGSAHEVAASCQLASRGSVRLSAFPHPPGRSGERAVRRSRVCGVRPARNLTVAGHRMGHHPKIPRAPWLRTRLTQIRLNLWRCFRRLTSKRMGSDLWGSRP